jgi:hypothetical protein
MGRECSMRHNYERRKQIERRKVLQAQSVDLDKDRRTELPLKCMRCYSVGWVQWAQVKVQ